MPPVDVTNARWTCFAFRNATARASWRASLLRGSTCCRSGSVHRQQVVEADVPVAPDAGAAFLSGIGFPRGGLALPASFNEVAVDPGFFKLQPYECLLPSPEIGL